MTTTDSPESPLTKTPEETLRNQMETDSNLKLLGRMMGLKSLNRNLKAEDQAVAQNIAFTEAELRQQGWKGDVKKRWDDPMDIMATGDVYVNQPPQDGAQSSNKPGLPPWLKAGLLVAGAGLAGGGATTLWDWFSQESPLPIEQRDYEMELLPPDPFPDESDA